MTRAQLARWYRRLEASARAAHDPATAAHWARKARRYEGSAA